MDVQLTGLSAGTKYYVQVRAVAKGDKSQVSEWSNPYPFTTTSDTVPPAPVTGLTFEVEGSAFKAKWTAPINNANGTKCTDLAGYKLQFRDTTNPTVGVPAEIQIVGTSYTLSLEENRALFGGTAKPNLTLEVVAIDQIGNRSTFVSATASNPPPANVTGLTVENGLESLVCKWNANTDKDLTGYEVHVSTTGAGFTPDATTLRYKGPGIAFTVPSFNMAQHWVKVYATDIFDQKSVSPATGTGTPRQTGSSDGTSPGAPTAITLASTDEAGQLKVSWTPPVDTDVDRFVIRYGLDTLDFIYTTVPSGETFAIVDGVRPGQNYYVGVQAIDFSGNKSSWGNASPYPYTTVASTRPVPKPKPGIFGGSTGQLLVYQDGLDEFENPVEGMRKVEVWLVAGEFDNTPVMNFASIDYAGSSALTFAVIPFIRTEYDTELWWGTRFVDYDGTAGPVSDPVLMLSNLIKGQNLADATIGDAKIGSLSADKLIANSAFINNLNIRSKLTIDDVNGSVESDNFSVGSETGWRINRNGITIYNGTVKASALEIQNSPNIIPPQYSDFEFGAQYYFNTTTNVANPTYLSTSKTSLRLALSSTSRFTNQSLRFYDTSSTIHNYLYLGPTSGTTVAVAGGQRYTFSIYVRNQLGTAKNFRIVVSPDVGSSFEATVSIPAGATWTRVSCNGVVDINATKALLYFGSPTATPIDFLIDGGQFERQVGSLTTPSPWSPNGQTVIDGGSIITGSIRSSAPAVGVSGQPAWSLNTEGNAQFGDVIVRGNLTVGAGADTTASVVRSANFATGASGWVIRGDGTVEFNSGVFRGTLGAGIVTAASLETNLVLSDKIIAGTAGGVRMEMTGGTGANAGLIAYSAASTKSLQINTNGTFTAFNTSGQRTLDIDTSGNFRTYNASTQATIFTLSNLGAITIANSGGNTFSADAAGNLTIRGKIMTAASGARIEIEPGVGITFYASTTSTSPRNYTRWYHYANTDMDGISKAGFMIDSPSIQALRFYNSSDTRQFYSRMAMATSSTEMWSFRVHEQTNNNEHSRMMIRAKDIEVVAGPTLNANGNDAAYVWNNWAPMLYMPWGGHAGAGTPGAPIILLSHLKNNTGNTLLHRSGFQGAVDPNIAAVIYSTGGLILRDFTNSIYTTFTAGNINGGIIKYNQLVQNTSGIQFKENFESLPEKGLDVIRNAPISMWNYTDRPDDTRIGPIATDLPDWLTVDSTQVFTEEEDAGDYTTSKTLATKQSNSSYDLTSIIGVLWEAVRELDEELDAYRQELGYTLPQRRFTHKPEEAKEMWVENIGMGEVVDRPERPTVIE